MRITWVFDTHYTIYRNIHAFFRGQTGEKPDIFPENTSAATNALERGWSTISSVSL
jgi:hypothetical protein